MKKIVFGNRREIIATKHVFTKNNQVYIRNGQGSNEAPDEWLPIQFQWIPTSG